MATPHATEPARPFTLTLETFMPDLLRVYPQTRAVLDRYGLRGCGGPEGPHESLQFFAHAHGVDERTLMDELRQAIARSAHHHTAARADGNEGGLADRIYRPFFLGGIGVVLTLGAVWGAWLLWEIGIKGNFRAVGIYQINAHGHAMIFGWVGLFIMGFALQALPRMWHVELPAPRLAMGSFGAMVVGIVIRSLAMAGGGVGWRPWVALGGGVIELAAIVSVCGILLAAFQRKAVKTEPYMAFILAGLGWFILQAAYGLWHIWMLMTASGSESLTWYLSTYQAPLRDMQIHGLALFMILGVSMRLFPPLFGLKRIEDRRAWLALGLLTGAVVGEIGLFLAYRWSGRVEFAYVLLGAWVMLAVGVWVAAAPWKLWRPLVTYDRSGKFIRIAYGWLAVSLAMLILLPVYQAISRLAFSHAYYGAIRHAVTVGFISMMIMGVAAKVVPTLTGRDPKTLSGLWGPFLLVNTGCFLRVSLQTLTDWNPAFYAVIGVSGTLEVCGLAWWGVGLARMMLTTAPAANEAAPPPPRIEAEHNLGDVLRWIPQAQGILERAGFTMLRNPMARRAFAPRVTIGQAAGMRGVALGPLLEELNRAMVPAVLKYDVSLAELRRRLPEAERVLERHGITFEGSMTLERAAEMAGVSKESLVSALAQCAVVGHDACSGQCCDSCGHGEAAEDSCGCGDSLNRSIPLEAT